jgi:hypothetical protein
MQLTRPFISVHATLAGRDGAALGSRIVLILPNLSRNLVTRLYDVQGEIQPELGLRRSDDIKGIAVG